MGSVSWEHHLRRSLGPPLQLLLDWAAGCLGALNKKWRSVTKLKRGRGILYPPNSRIDKDVNRAIFYTFLFLLQILTPSPLETNAS